MRKLTPDSLASTNLGEVIWTNNRPKDLYIKDWSEPEEGKKIFWDLTPTYPKLHSCETNFVIGGGLAGHLRSPLWLCLLFVGLSPPLVVHRSQIIHLTDLERYQLLTNISEKKNNFFRKKNIFNSTFKLKSVSIYHKWFFFCESFVKILWM